MAISKKTIFILIALVILIGLVIGGYLFWNIRNNQKKTALPATKTIGSVGEVADKITENATRGVLPSIETNLLKNKPDVNPADKTNPFKNIKTNPFK